MSKADKRDSRRHRKIARRACDFCVKRKTQCSFAALGDAACIKCTGAGVACTFLQERKPRGPPSRRLAEYRKRTGADGGGPGPASSPHSPATGSDGLGSRTDGSPPDRPDRGRDDQEPPQDQSRQPLHGTPASTALMLPPGSALGPLPGGVRGCLLGPVTLEHFLPEASVLRILRDFADNVYPVVPLVHLPSFQADLQRRRYATDPGFLRLCLGLCAATVASSPNLAYHGYLGYNDRPDAGSDAGSDAYHNPGGHPDARRTRVYPSVGALVSRASHLVMLSRLATQPDWLDAPSVDGLLESLLLAIAALYAQGASALSTHACSGRAHIGDAQSACYALELYRARGYAALAPIQAELAKRAFWVLFFVQVHDRLSNTVPRTGLNYDPWDTDWDFLVPRELDDEALARMQGDPGGYPPASQALPSPHADAHRPLIVGFIALSKIFLAAAQVLGLSMVPVPSGYSIYKGDAVCDREDADDDGGDDTGNAGNAGNAHTAAHDWPEQAHLRRDYTGLYNLRDEDALSAETIKLSRLEALVLLQKKMAGILEALPPELRLPMDMASMGGGGRMGPAAVPKDSLLAHQFGIMKANIHITSLHIQSVMLEMCLASLRPLPDAEPPVLAPVLPGPALSAASCSVPASALSTPTPTPLLTPILAGAAKGVVSMPPTPPGPSSVYDYGPGAGHAERVSLPPPSLHVLPPSSAGPLPPVSALARASGSVDYAHAHDHHIGVVGQAAQARVHVPPPPSVDAYTMLRSQLWSIRKTLTQQLMDVLDYFPLDDLQWNGNSVVVKIRQIATTLLENDDGGWIVYGESPQEAAERNRAYLDRFVQVLARLDVPPEGYG